MDPNEALLHDLFAAPSNRKHAPLSVPEPSPAGDGVAADSGVDIANEVIVSLGYYRTSGPISYDDGFAQYARIKNDGRTYFISLTWDGENLTLSPKPFGEEFTEKEAPQSAVLGKPVALSPHSS